MGNPLRGEVTFKAGDAEKTLVFSVNTFCDLEDETGLGVNALVAELEGNLSFRLLRTIFCAGLQEKHPGTTAKEAGDIMTAAGMEEITEALQRALSAAMPEATDDEDARPQNRKERRAARTK